jgi:SAM-dependent methyltransferase
LDLPPDNTHLKAQSKILSDRVDAASSLGRGILTIHDSRIRLQTWNDLHNLTYDKEDIVRLSALQAIGDVFSQVPFKILAWQDIHRLAKDKNPFIRKKTIDVLCKVFNEIPEKTRAWHDLHLLTQDGEYIVRWNAVEVMCNMFSQAPNKVQAWQDIVRLTKDKERIVRWSAAQTLKIAFNIIPDKSMAEGDLSNLIQDDDYVVRLKAAEILGLGFFHISDKEQALNDLFRLTQDEYDIVRWRAIELLKEIEEKSELLCKTASPNEARIGCKIKKHATTALTSDNPIEVHNELDYILRIFEIWSNSIPNDLERNYVKDVIADAKNENLLNKSKNIRILLGEIMKNAKKYVIIGSVGIQINEGNENVQNMDLGSHSDEKNLEYERSPSRIPHLSHLESEIYGLFAASTHQKLRKQGVSEAKSKTLEMLKSKLMDLTLCSEKIEWLDIGCGDGRSLEIFDDIPNRDPIRYHGIDQSYKHRDEAEKRALGYGLRARFDKMDAATMNSNSEYDIISAILLFHEINPICLPHVLRNVIQSLKDDGTFIFSDFQSPYEQEKNIVVWTYTNILNILDNICDEVKANIKDISADKYPEEFGFYSGYIKKSSINNEKFIEFLQKYDGFLERKKEDSKKERSILRSQIETRVHEILGRSDIDAENISENDMNHIRNEIEERYGIKAFKIKLLTEEVEYLDNKIIDFRSGKRCF